MFTLGFLIFIQLYLVFVLFSCDRGLGVPGGRVPGGIGMVVLVCGVRAGGLLMVEAVVWLTSGGFQKGFCI